MIRFKALALDFDCTVADTNPLHMPARLEAFRQMAIETGDDRFNLVSPDLHVEAHKHGSNPHMIIGWTLQQAQIVPIDANFMTHPLVEATVTRKHSAYDELAKDGAPEIPGASQFIRKASKRFGRSLFVVTNARLKEEVKPFFKAHNLQACFEPDQLITRESVATEQLKPHPAAYQLALERAGLIDRPSLLAVVEDSAHGIEAAKRAGATVIGITTTLTYDEMAGLQGYQAPDYIVTDFAELEDILLSN